MFEVRREGGGCVKEQERMRGEAGALGEGCAETDKGGVKEGKETLGAPKSSLAHHFHLFQSVSSVAQSCPTLCDPMNRSTPGLPVHHHLWSSLKL